MTGAPAEAVLIDDVDDEAPGRSETARTSGRDVSPPGWGGPGEVRRARSHVNDRLLVGRILTALGVVLVLFVGFEFGVSNLIEARAQRTLLGQFQGLVRDAAARHAPLVPRLGQPVAILSIPRLGFTQVVVEGGSPQLLKEGPGHLQGTAEPGQAGNAVIAGRRTTYGAPFRALGDVSIGDIVWVTTSDGWFRYRVTMREVVRPGQPDPVAPTLDARLTLITSDPSYRAGQRLLAVAKLLGPALAPAGVQPVPPGVEQAGLSGDGAAVPLILLWAELLAVALIGSWRLYRRWSRTMLSAYLLTTPILLALLFLLFGALDRLLPATL
jgi:sortase A